MRRVALPHRNAANGWLEAMLAMGSPLGLIPEQVWDSAPIPERGLAIGKPSGSAMPLVWAHAEFVKLCYEHVRGYPVDRPAATWRRYGGVRPELNYDIWGPTYRPRRVRAGNALSIALTVPARAHWGINGWNAVADIQTRDTGVGVHVADLPVTALVGGETVQFTFLWWETETWEGVDYEALIME